MAMSRTQPERDPLGRAFAQLTAELEDVTSLAVQGQDRRKSVRSRRKIAFGIRGGLVRAGDILDRIGRRLNGPGVTR